MASNLSPSGSKVTISDIAKESGVSPATVSLVLREKPGVGDDTRRRVFEVAQTLGYLPPATSSRATATAELKHIGLIMKMNPADPPDTNHFYSPVINGIEAVCRQRKSHLLYAHLPVDEHNQPLELPRLLTDEQVDGILLIGMEITEGLLAHLKQKNIPVVLVDGYAEGDPFDAVVTDNLKGGMQATQHLIELGHRHIGLLGSTPDAYPSIRERREGYERAMRAAGLTPIYGDSQLRPENAVEAAEALLKTNPDITAFFVCNDESAIAVMKRVQALGRKVPQDISIIGFDNIVLAQHVTPALSTMRVDKMSMGRLAAQMMFNRLEYPKAAQVKTIIQPERYSRESVSKSIN